MLGCVNTIANYPKVDRTQDQQTDNSGISILWVENPKTRHDIKHTEKYLDFSHAALIITGSLGTNGRQAKIEYLCII
ncbi:hypothetical protein evm_001472 [Chilo suppressalis]|nr:hypothetical protein evm_001472 [Chilo suppressalis]